ncbi:cerebellin-1-like [Alosa pseudoharengus]|uniref:cerebellin-1-like n=1 Tax=Alosa pseudoharengus TaxID=34774 RepID=UPI003F8BBC52
MVVELRVLLTVTQNELQNTKAELQNTQAENAAQQTELATMKTEVINLIQENAAQEIRLSASETKMEVLNMETAALEAELTAVKTRLAATETEVVNLEKEITEQPKVAFSAGLTNGSIQAGNTDLNLVFTKIITNVGQAYSSTTGFFTAPVRGVYYFRFTVMDLDLIDLWVSIRMCRNGEQVIYLSGYDSDRQRLYLSSGATLQLEVGDVVNMRLPAGNRLYDDTNRTTFSGFLLFPL